MRKDGSSSARSGTRRAIAKTPDGLGNAVAAAESLIATVERDLDRDLAAVLAGLDWSDPRLAFYGETNAGKSTLIEALRLIFAVHGEIPGSTIGDGSPDFTRRTNNYPCEIDGTRFSLVDVPGIEGSEAAVAAEISAALRSAHLVFLVVGEARPPQGGDGKNLGTLEKIARDLRPQAKVWAVFNKRITSPRQLEGQLVDDDELLGLTGGSNSLDGKLRAALGDRYQRHVCVSAMPGFLAVAGDTDIDARFARQRSKFVAAHEPAALVELSGLSAFAQLIVSIVPGRDDIVTANLKKLIPVMRLASGRIEEHAAREFLWPAEALDAQLSTVADSLGSIVAQTRRGMSRLVNDVTNGSVRRIREVMLAEITAGVADDDDLKRRLDNAIEEERQNIGDIVNSRLGTAASLFRHACRDALHLLKQHLRHEDAFASRSFTASFVYASKIETRSGIDWAGLASAIGGGALLTGITGGWFLVLGLISTGLGILNSIKFYLNGSFRRDQQKRAVNRALDEARARLATDVTRALDAAQAALEDDAENVVIRLRAIREDHLEAWRRAHVAAAELDTIAEDRPRLLAKAERACLDKGLVLGDVPSTR